MEILFRGKHTPHWWDQEKKIWITYPTVWVYGHYYEDFDYGQGEKHKTHTIVDAGGGHYPVDLNTVSMFTTEYDSTGERLFEGDIIDYTQHLFNTERTVKKRKVIEWKHACWGIYETRAGESDIVKIGNRWDNPELLK